MHTGLISIVSISHIQFRVFLISSRFLRVKIMEKKQLTTTSGRPVGDNQNSLTVGPRGPVVFEDFLLFEKMAHFNRERIPERVVHAKGSGAYGHFICTNPDMPPD